MRKPVIGVTCNYDYKDEVGMVSHMGISGQKWHFLADSYVNSIERAGGIPVLIPICEDIENVKAMCAGLDAVLISGGHDVNPQEYGERVKGYCGTIMPMRDRQDIELTKYIVNETKKPLLAICRGVQILNVAAGGNLYQDLEKEGGFEHHFTDMYPLNYPTHTVSLKEGTILKQIFGTSDVKVNSFHHQAVKKTGKGFVASAVSEDGVVEAIEKENADGRFVVGVQWHPEMMFDTDAQQAIFRAFVNACECR